MSTVCFKYYTRNLILIIPSTEIYFIIFNYLKVNNQLLIMNYLET